MSLPTRIARAIPRQRIPIPASALQSRSRLLLSNHRHYHYVYQLYRSRFSTHAGIQAPEHPKDTPPHPTPLLNELACTKYPRGRSGNPANRIQNELEEKGHRVWGFVVYRCTYGDDAAWEKCLERLKASTRETLCYYGGLDLLEKGRFKLTVIAGARFDGVKTQCVREHFKEWRKKAVLEEQGSPEEIEARRKKPEPRYLPYGESRFDEAALTRSMQDAALLYPPPDYVLPHLPLPGPCSYGTENKSMAPRYRFCIQIDEAAMRSILSGDDFNAWVNVIEADWRSKDAAIQFEEAWVGHVDSGLDKDSFDHYVDIFLPEIEGCVEENVGWMKADYTAVMTGFYACVCDPDNLDEFLYWRPPTMLPPGLC
jgi:hypothetical protein